MQRGWRTFSVLLCLLAAILAGCGEPTRHKVLKIFFDGVPEPKQPGQAPQGAAAPAPTAIQTTYTVHGPYAARLCEACHVKQTNALVVPVSELCYQCHELRLDKKYIHGPLASGGCILCHDPHSSPNRYMLIAESTTFCVRCHDAAEIAKNPAHQDSEQQCTDCHDAHMSDKPYLLK